MKSVLISIQPKWVEKITSGEKTIEVRKTAPKCDVPFKCYIYCTESDVHSALVVGDGNAKLIHCCNYKSAIPVGGVIGNGKVIGEFVCDKIITVDCDSVAPFDPDTHEYIQEETCLDRAELIRYTNFRKALGWHISDLKIYDKPRELSEFYASLSCKVRKLGVKCITRPPQS